MSTRDAARGHCEAVLDPNPGLKPGGLTAECLAVGDKGLVGQTEASLNKLTADQCVLLRWEMHVGFSDVQRRRRSVLV